MTTATRFNKFSKPTGSRLREPEANRFAPRIRALSERGAHAAHLKSARVAQSALHTYENVLVSSVAYNFSMSPHQNVPPALLADWARLITALAKVDHPGFGHPPIPNPLEFLVESVTSDGPYGSDENFYYLDSHRLHLKRDDGVGLMISFEMFRQGGDDAICMETTGFRPNISSSIFKAATAPRARVRIWHKPEQRSEFRTILCDHEAYCGRQ